MKGPQQGKSVSQKGFSLVEILVATAVFAIAVGVAFTLYNAAQSSYKDAEEFTSQQQNTRVAFDRIVSELRMAGFNYNPDGDLTRPDEQIEGAWDTAVTFRGDMDFEVTPAEDSVNNNQIPELTLDDGIFNVVSVGNDEIITYALGKPDGSGGVDLVFNADVQESPRDGDVEPVRIENIHLDQSSPPYTLYRIIHSNDTTDYGNWGEFSIKQAISDNIKSLRFRYFDGQGNQLNTFDLTQTSDDIGGDDSAATVSTRAAIRRVELDIVGLTPNPDKDYTDWDDAIAATRKYRKFSLVSDVTMANLGFTGMVDNILGTPRPPQNVAACLGHCEGIILEWENVHEAEDAITSYTLWYGTDPSTLDTPLSTSDLWVWVGNLTGGPYYFGVESKNGSGINSAIAGPINATPTNDTRPLAIPGGTLWASGGDDASHPFLDSQIDLGWSVVSENTSEGASDAVFGCDPIRPVNRDLAGYRIYRDTVSGFTPGTPIATETDLPGLTSWSDTAVVNCKDFYYVVTAVDGCGAESDTSSPIRGFAETIIPPAAPQNMTAVQTSPNSVDISWDPVTENAASPPRPVLVSGYNVYMAEMISGLDPDSIPEGSYFLIAGLVTETSYTHWFSGVLPGNSLYFKVTALDDCPNESAKSQGAESTCDFQGSVSFDPPDGASLSGVVELLLSVSGSASYVRSEVRIPSPVGGGNTYYQENFNPTNSGPGTDNFPMPDWNTAGIAPGTYQIIYEVENSMGCLSGGTVTVTVNSVIPCCVDAANPNLKPIKGKASAKNSKLSFDIINNCAKDIELIGLDVSWTENVGDIQALEITEYPTGTVVFTLSPPEPTPAFADLLATPLFLSQFNDSLSPLNMLLDWTGPMAEKSGSTVTSETITTTFTYRTVGATEQGFCTMQIKPDEGTIESTDGS